MTSAGGCLVDLHVDIARTLVLVFVLSFSLLLVFIRISASLGPCRFVLIFGPFLWSYALIPVFVLSSY